MIIVDTNVVAYLLIPGTHTAASEALRSTDHDWHAPGLFRHEWLNVVTMQVRIGTLDRDEGVRLYRRGISSVQMDDGPPDPLRIINLHLLSGCSSYDCQFVELAQRLNVRLVTVDGQVIAAFPGVADSLAG